MSNPQLSIVIAAQGSVDETRRCLQSLLSQQLGRELELIVAEAQPGKSKGMMEAEFPQVIYVACSSPASLPLLHGAGMARAKAELIAITEGHCTFPANWLGTVLDTCSNSSGPVIGGTVLPGQGLNLLNLALFLVDYAQFLLPMESGVTDDLPGNNVVFKRECLKDIDGFGQGGFWKTFYCKELESKGVNLLQEPSITVLYNRKLSLGQVASRRYHHGRCFGGMRAEQVGAGKRLLYALAGPVLPFLLIYKYMQRAWPKVQYRKILLLSLPYAFGCALVWSVGEWTGNLLGAGNSCQRL